MHKFTPLYLIALLFIFVDEAKAQTIQLQQPPGTGFQVGNRSGAVIFQTLLTNVITIIFSIASFAVLVMIIWGAFDWIISGGDKEKIKSAQKRITTAIIGAVVLSLAFFITRVLGAIIGIDFRSFKIPSLL